MLRLIIIEIIILAVQGALYFGCETLQHGHKDVKRAIDDRIPFLPGFSYIYLLWFPLIAFFPLCLFTASGKAYTVYQLSIIVSILTSTLLYLLFPTRFERQVPEDSPWSEMMRLIYTCNFKGSNCSPSLHCTQCYIIMLTACLCGVMYPGDIVFLLIICALIVVSTVMIKQHALIDVLTAVPLAAGSFWAGWYLTSHFGYENILRLAGLL